MKQSLLLFALVAVVLGLGQRVWGGAGFVAVVYGAMALMALMIAATFLWLWVERATPLALGMVYAWAGAAVLIGWGWAQAMPGGAGANLFARLGLVVQALYLVGALLHFAVIHRSFGFHGVSFLWPLVLSLAISVLVTALA